MSKPTTKKELTDLQIKAWIKGHIRFENDKAVGNGLYIRYVKGFLTPVWRYRYRIAGIRKVMVLGSYENISLTDARKLVKEFNARVALGYDVAAEKQERLDDVKAKHIEVVTVGKIADDYFTQNILNRWKHPNIVRSRIEKDIKPNIGKMAVVDVKPMHIDDMLKMINKRNVPTVANDVLRWTKRIFNHAIKRHIIQYNPASPFDLTDAGGKEYARERALTRDEITQLFEAMRITRGFSQENYLTIKLLLLLAVRKQELTAARKEEFDLDEAIWYLPRDRTKTETAIAIPLTRQAVEALRDLFRMAGNSDYIRPAIKAQDRQLPHIHENTLNVALSKVKKNLPGMESFCVHDLRRTARTQLSALGVQSHIAERCLNHKLKGIEGRYDTYDFFDERKEALQLLANCFEALETGKDWNVTPIKKRA